MILNEGDFLLVQADSNFESLLPNALTIAGLYG